MTDLVLVVATLAFIALCVAYVGWCDHIIGDDPTPPTDNADGPTVAAVDATGDRTVAVPVHAGGGAS